MALTPIEFEACIAGPGSVLRRPTF